MKNNKALLVVDVQNDFCPGGALAVPQGDKVVVVINKYIEYFVRHHWPIFASRDWHPARTKHFKDYGGIWPVHCVQNSAGAAFHPGLKLPEKTVVISKGMTTLQDGYSAFEALDQYGKDFSDLLQEYGARDLYVGGLATDYCVKSSVLNALKRGLNVYLLIDAIKGVNLKPKDSEFAIAEMMTRGAKQLIFSDLPRL